MVIPQVQEKVVKYMENHLKVTGESIYSMLKLEEALVDENVSPLYPPRLIKTMILNNPFSDIIPRIIVQESEEVKENSKEFCPDSIILYNEKFCYRDFNRLSFSADTEEDEEESVILNKKFSGKDKSGHDHLTDAKLSSQSADESLGLGLGQLFQRRSIFPLQKYLAYPAAANFQLAASGHNVPIGVNEFESKNIVKPNLTQNYTTGCSPESGMKFGIPWDNEVLYSKEKDQNQWKKKSHENPLKPLSTSRSRTTRFQSSLPIGVNEFESKNIVKPNLTQNYTTGCSPESGMKFGIPWDNEVLYSKEKDQNQWKKKSHENPLKPLSTSRSRTTRFQSSSPVDDTVQRANVRKPARLTDLCETSGDFKTAEACNMGLERHPDRLVPPLTRVFDHPFR
ncbi:Peptidyl-prolyl isomerase cwc27 [Eufriesea mexicana]|nr:Peptidyl-prolyl isomerase cwc27 [Eufriesea mexicana]